jgi:preprotein translocase subunit SecA
VSLTNSPEPVKKRYQSPLRAPQPKATRRAIVDAAAGLFAASGHVATSVDDLEEAFQRKKRRELEQARMAGGGEQKTVQQVVRGAEKVGRNDPCPCGSGKKYKKCHGA